ncbi:hypothetical protein [Streptomyces sp. NPDC093544]|uniref:hypothetical protein n=1 Tax=Streptomyces sp. NPDC093544 TaxID=3155200 RepID=UPI003446C37F
MNPEDRIVESTSQDATFTSADGWIRQRILDRFRQPDHHHNDDDADHSARAPRSLRDTCAPAVSSAAGAQVTPIPQNEHGHRPGSATEDHSPTAHSKAAHSLA